MTFAALLFLSVLFVFFFPGATDAIGCVGFKTLRGPRGSLGTLDVEVTGSLIRGLITAGDGVIFGSSVPFSRAFIYKQIVKEIHFTLDRGEMQMPIKYINRHFPWPKCRKKNFILFLRSLLSRYFFPVWSHYLNLKLRLDPSHIIYKMNENFVIIIN